MKDYFPFLFPKNYCFIAETPELWSLFLSKRLLVECCLTSNVKCGTVADIKSHHFQKLIRINNPIAICVSRLNSLAS